MTVGTVETAKEVGGNGDGLRRSPTDAATQGVSVRTMGWQPTDTPCIEQIGRLPIVRIGVRIVRKADDGRGPESIREIPAKGGHVQ